MQIHILLPDTVGRNGKIATLDNLSNIDDESSKTKASSTSDATVKDEPGSKRIKLEDGTFQETAADPANIKEDHFKEAEAELAKLIAPELATKAIEVVKYWEGRSKKDTDDSTMPQNYVLPIVSEKDKRTKIHKLIKSDLLCKYAVADTVDSKIRIWALRFRKNSRDKFFGKQKKKKNEWPKDRPDYLSFVLYKENMDTNMALKNISRFSKIQKRNIVNVAGMKDKRGITTQYCTVYRQTPDDLLCLNKGNNRNQASVYKVGNFEYVKHNLRLGRLQGNRFDIALRNISVGDSIQEKEDMKKYVDSCCTSFQKTGFINYFGMQRFGKNKDTHKVGIAVLQGNFKSAVDIILSLPESDKAKPIEDLDDYRRAMLKWSTRFDSVKVDSDDEEELKKAKLEAERKCAGEILKGLRRFMLIEISLMSSLSRMPGNYKVAFKSIAKNTQLMYVHAVQSYIWNHAASHRAIAYHNYKKEGASDGVLKGDLVLVENKSEDQGGSGTSGLRGKSVKVVTEDDVSSGKYSLKDVVLPLVGSMVKYPETDDVNESLYDKIVTKELGLSGKKVMERNQDGNMEFSLGGDYRRFICRPNDVTYELREYKDPIETLIQTDLMKVQGTELSCEKRTQGDNTSKLLGLVVGFTLPPSSYATIALRELTKRPTSTDYQSKLVLEGKCDEKVVKA